MAKDDVATVESIDGFRRWVKGLKCRERRWIFRGQVNPNWPLRTSLERAFLRTPPIERLTRRKAEEIMLREFKRHCHRYWPSEGVGDNLEWLALMQHYGAPTRLQDWTWSENIALFFALRSAGVELSKKKTTSRIACAVWAVNQKECWTKFTTSLRQINEPMYAKLKRNDKDSEVLNFVLNTEWPQPLVAPLNPFRIDQRRHMQQSTFLVPLAAESPFDVNLTNMLVQADRRKVVFETSVQDLPVHLMELRRSNVTPLTLSPDIDGLAGSVWHVAYLPELRPKEVDS